LRAQPDTLRLALAVTVSLLAACHGKVVADPTIGKTDGACNTDGSCDVGLVCIDRRCIDPAVSLCDGVGCGGHGTCVIDAGAARCDCLSGYHASGANCIADAAARLQWSPPTENADGTPLCDLAGYWVQLGSRPRTTAGFAGYDMADDIGVPACGPDDHEIQICTYVIDSLPSGTWYFAVTSYDILGNVSDLSNEASRVVP
jgi:hypothetical protein